jgi:hypothetical protein
LPYRKNIMGVILAALFFGLITFGFTLLTVLPFFLLWLMVGVYLEPRSPDVVQAQITSADEVLERDLANSNAKLELEANSTSVDGAGLESLTPGHHLVPSGRELAGSLR